MGSWIDITAGGVTTRHDYDVAAVSAMHGTDAAKAIASWVDGMVEQLILEGHNHIEVEWSFPPNHYHLTVPAWYLQPYKRARVEWGRWRYRRGAGEGDG
jgi:hypothetical protein